ncbi:ABC transporter substrate-binding protein [Nocardioides ultimimeridianus]
MISGITTRARRIGALATAAALALALAGCGGGTIKDNTSAAGKPCGKPVNIALNAWVGYTADAYVIGNVLEQKLSCQVNYVKLAEQPSWAGMANGTVDTIVENWGHDDLIKKYIDQQHVVQDAGLTGNTGVIGWFVPPWMAQKYPDITDWHNLNKYASLFKTSESGSQGQLLDGDPSYVTNDQALVTNLHLNYKVVVGGSEAALIQSFRTAEANKTPLLAYFYEPQWFFSEMKLVKVNLPKYTPGCDADPAKVACDYPPYQLNKLISSKFADSGSPAVDVIKNFKWTNDDQNEVAKAIAKDGKSPDQAAQAWIAAHQSEVDSWISG